MKWVALPILLSLMTVSIAGQYPIYGGNGIMMVTVFDAFKVPQNAFDLSSEKYLLYIDLGITYTNSTYAEISGNKFTLVDGNYRVYNQDFHDSKALQEGRSLLTFLVPREAVPKNLIVDPSSVSGGGERFIVDFGGVLNNSSPIASLRYYGIVDNRIYSQQRTLNLDVGVSNNGTSPMDVSPQNFSLEDQWGWTYKSESGFDPRSLAPNESMRSLINFKPISPSSVPAKLIFQPPAGDYLVIYLLDTQTTSHELEDSSAPAESEAQSTCSVCQQQQQSQDDGSVKGAVAAAKERLAKMREKSDTSE